MSEVGGRGPLGVWAIELSALALLSFAAVILLVPDGRMPSAFWRVTLRSARPEHSRNGEISHACSDCRA